MQSNPDAPFDELLDDILEDERAATMRQFHEQTCEHAAPIDEGNDLSVLHFAL